MRIRSTTMVGRSAELAALRECLDDVRGAGSAVFVVGEAGIGKSRLVAEAVAGAYDAGMTVLQGRTGTVGPPVPYRPLTEALLALARSGEVPDDPALAPYRAVLGWLVPEWQRAGGGEQPTSPLVLAEAVIRTVAAAGSQAGSLLVMEDLHDADVETLAVVEYLADNVARQPIALLVTIRHEGDTALDLVTALAGRSGSTVLELERLTRAQSDELVGECLGQPPSELPAGITERIWLDASGNPFLVEELLRHLVASGRLGHGDRGWRLHPVATPDVPTTLVRRISQRAERLGERGVDVLAAAAVLGRRFPVSVLQRVTGLDDHTLLVHLRAALTAQLVQPDDSAQDWYTFQHGLTADAVLAMLAPAERARLSLAAAEAVTCLHPELPGDWCQLAARLRAGAGDDPGAAALHLEAGRRALRSGAAGSAVALLEAAETLLAGEETGQDAGLRSEVLTTLLYALAESGRFDRAFELAEQLDDVGLDAHRRAAVALRLAWAAHVSGQWAAGREQTRVARVLLDAAPSRSLAAELAAVDACVTLEAPGPERYPRAEALAREALALAAGLGRPEVEAQAWNLLGQVERERDLVESERCFRRVRDIAEQHRLPIWRIYALQGSAANSWLADGDGRGLRDAREQALAAGAISLARGMDGIEALHHTLRGEFAQAEAIVADRLETVTRLRMGGMVRYLLMVRATIAAHRLDRPEMEKALGAFAAAGGDTSKTGPLAVGLAGVFCALLEEDRALALRELETVRRAQEQQQSTFFLAGHHGLGLLLDAIAPGCDVRPAPPGAHPAAQMRWNRQFVLLAEAVRLGRAGHADEAAARVEEAAEVSRPYPLAHHLGLRLVGEVAVRDGWADAEPWLRAAEAFFHDMGAPAVASACRGLLRSTGASVRQRRDGADRVPAGLRALGVTVREYDVLVELAGHLGNKAIAARLHISPRTVEKHVASLLLKTACSDRAGLIAHIPAT